MPGQPRTWYLYHNHREEAAMSEEPEGDESLISRQESEDWRGDKLRAHLWGLRLFESFLQGQVFAEKQNKLRSAWGIPEQTEPLHFTCFRDILSDYEPQRAAWVFPSSRRISSGQDGGTRAQGVLPDSPTPTGHDAGARAAIARLPERSGVKLRMPDQEEDTEFRWDNWGPWHCWAGAESNTQGWKAWVTDVSTDRDTCHADSHTHPEATNIPQIEACQERKNSSSRVGGWIWITHRQLSFKLIAN